MAQKNANDIFKSISSGKSVGSVGLVVLVIFALFGFFGSKAQNVASGIVNENLSSNTSNVNTETNKTTIIRVVDGDTLEIIDGRKIRLIGVDTPETVDPRKPVQCFGKEASARTKELVEGKEVELIIDETQGDTDKYGRMLRFVTLANGDDLGELLISNGYAHEYTYDENYLYQEEYKLAEQEAKNKQKGLWNPEICP